MIPTLAVLVQELLAVAVFGALVLPPGILATAALHRHSAPPLRPSHLLLWSTTLGLALATLISVLIDRHLTTTALTLLHVLLLVAAAASLLRTHTSLLPVHLSRPLRLAACALTLFPLLAVTDIQLGHRLFISTVMSDWAVRVPIVNRATLAALPITNPLSALTGAPPALHYYYFWYVLCAQIARLAHLPGRVALTASCVWAAFALLAAALLALRHLLGIRSPLRAVFSATLLAGCVIGLDVLPLIPRLLVHREHPDFEIEWWREDRTPSFLGTILYAPHHIAGLAIAVTGFVLLVCLLDGDRRPTLAATLRAALLAGCCFAAVAGTSTYLAFLLAIACLLWTIDLASHRQARLIAALALTGVFALLLSAGYLHELVTTNTGNQIGGAGAGSAAHFAVVRLRNAGFADILLQRRHLHVGHLVYQGLRLAVSLLLAFFELGFFCFVLIRQAVHDLRRPTPLLARERALWWLLLGAALPALLLSSAVVTFANDLGMHAGILVRFVLLLWAGPWLLHLWSTRAAAWRTSLPRLAFLSAAAVCFLLGLAGEAAQLFLERLSLPLIETRLLPKRTDTFTADRLSYRLFNIRAAYQALNPLLPANAILQFDPAGRLQPAMALYSNRQIASSDDGCGTGFGGDHTLCEPVRLELHALFGVAPYQLLDSQLPMQDRGSIEEPTPTTPYIATNTDFLTACRNLRLSAILVDSMDPVWSKPTSWVWTEQPVFTSPTARAFLCPAQPTPPVTAPTPAGSSPASPGTPALTN